MDEKYKDDFNDEHTEIGGEEARDEEHMSGTFDEVPEEADGLGELSERREAQGTPSRPDYLLPASILIAAILISGTIIYSISRGGLAAPQAQTGNASLDATLKLTSRDVIRGNPSAPVTLIEYGDYQCPFCARFFSDVEPQIRTSYIDTGKARMVFRNIAFLGQESVAAAIAAECAKDQSQFWPYHDALYQAKIGDTQKGGGEDDGFFNNKVFVGIATNLKMDVGAFTSCISSKKYDAAIAGDTQTAESAGIASTPTLYVNGQEIKGAQPFATFQGAIDAALAKAGK